MRLIGSLALSLAMAFAFVFAAAPARAADAVTDPAVRAIQTFYAALVDTMKKGKELGLEGRYRQLTPAVDAAFDLAEMTRLSVGPAWNTISEADHTAIVDAFKRMTIANYAKNFASFSGEQFTTDPMVKMRGADKIVESKLVGSDHATTPFNYRLRQAGDSWKIVDVYLNGYVSQLALRRSDYSSTLASAGAAGLAKKINDLADRDMKGG
jgi:phospholipid transport system substrate-binding protein